MCDRNSDPTQIDPEICHDCGLPVDDHDLRAFDGTCPDQPATRAPKWWELAVPKDMTGGLTGTPANALVL